MSAKMASLTSFVFAHIETVLYLAGMCPNGGLQSLQQDAAHICHFAHTASCPEHTQVGLLVKGRLCCLNRHILHMHVASCMMTLPANISPLRLQRHKLDELLNQGTRHAIGTRYLTS